MKKVMFLMAVAGMFAFASCGNTETPAENNDSAAQMEEPAATPAEDQANNDTCNAATEEAAADANAETAEAK